MKKYLEKILDFVSSKTFMTVLTFLGIYLFSTGVSYAVFSYLVAKPSGPGGTTATGIAGTRSKISEAPKTEACPINGQKFTKAEKDIWETRRPIAAMVENHAESRPPSGISHADVVYEAVAEGGITRYLTIFYCGASSEDVKIAPVRSARIYFIYYAAEYGKFPIFMHVGGANDYSGSGDTAFNVRALETLEQMDWRVPGGNDFDTTYDSGFPVFWRNYDRLDRQVATEHTMMASLDAAYTQAAQRGFGAKDSKGVAWDKNFVSWKFSDDKAVSSPDATDIKFGFWDDMPDYNVEWKYDSSKNGYLRFDGGKPHVDLENNQQFFAKDVAVIFAQETGPVDRNLHMFYTTVGTGKALVFQNGTVIKGTWEKDSTTARTKFFDASGKEISFVRGQIWLEVVPAGNTVSY